MEPTTQQQEPLVLVVTTVATREQARQIASTLVRERLVACAQISSIESFYVWNGELQHEPEARLTLKTLKSQYAAVESRIKQLHPYELPALFSLPVEQAYPPYAAWAAEGSRGEPARNA